MDKKLTLQVAIPTHAPEGISRIERVLLPPREGVGYVVSWQDHRNARIPDAVAARDDVEVLRFDGRGLSANRNNALEHCRADIILIGDDDLVYTRTRSTACAEFSRPTRKSTMPRSDTTVPTKSHTRGRQSP